MSDEFKFKLRVEEFQYAAERLAQYSKRDGETFMKEQIRGFIRHLLDFTPPSRGSRRGSKAKRGGDLAITADIRAVFRGVTDPKKAEADSMQQMLAILRSQRRSGSMRVAKGGEKTKAPRALIAELIKAKKARVGYLASAWATAAQGVGKKVHGLRGRVNAALRAQTRSMEKRVLFYIINVKNKSGFK